MLACFRSDCSLWMLVCGQIINPPDWHLFTVMRPTTSASIPPSCFCPQKHRSYALSSGVRYSRCLSTALAVIACSPGASAAIWQLLWYRSIFILVSMVTPPCIWQEFAFWKRARRDRPTIWILRFDFICDGLLPPGTQVTWSLPWFHQNFRAPGTQCSRRHHVLNLSCYLPPLCCFLILNHLGSGFINEHFTKPIKTVKFEIVLRRPQ